MCLNGIWMGRIISALFLVLILFSFSLITSRPIFAYYSNMSASLVLGQDSFTTSNTGVSSTAFNRTDGVIVAGNRLFLADFTSNRILVWNQFPTKNNTPADFVLGQPIFSTSTANNGGVSASTLSGPQGVFSDGTRLIVADTNNNRVLIWNSLPTVTRQAADVVIGQPDFGTTTAAVTASGFSSPQQVLIANGKLIIGEANNRRVLIYNNIPTTNGAAADVVIGQISMTTGAFGSLDAAHFGTASAGSGPRGLAFYDGKLVIADNSNARVLVWNSIPTTNGVSADVVIGQPNFVSNTADNGGISCATMEGTPGSIGVTSNGRLLITDNARLLVFNTIPSSNFTTADMVIGKPDCVTRTGGVSDKLTNTRIRGVFDFGGKLLVSDASNARLLIFNNVVATPEISFGGVEKSSDGKLRIKGSVKLGESGHYDLGLGGGFTFSINGADGAGVNTIGLASSDGAGSNFWEYSNDFEPWSNGNGTKNDWLSNFDEIRATRGFSVKLSVKSSNTDSSRFFYFEPFNMLSIAGGVARFQVSKYQIDRIKENVSYFEIQTKKGKENWKTYLTNISTDKIGSNGMVSAVTTSSLPPGDYQVKAVSVTKDSNLKQYSSILTTSLTSQIASITYINPNKYALTTGQWYPIQINGIPAGTNPTINGVAYAGSTVALRVTDAISGNTSDFYTTVKSDSSFSVTPTLYSSSILTFSVYDINGRYNELSPISVRGY